MTRLAASYVAAGHINAVAYQSRKFSSRYTKQDVELLAYVDKSHGNLSGPATKRILEREFGEYGQCAYERLSGISVAQLYRFRNCEAYRKRNTNYQPTRPTIIPLGERRKPRPQGRPGYLRLDTVHQGDKDGIKGIYHINAVDEVTQWEVVAATPQISEHWLIPLLEQLLEAVDRFHRQYLNPYVNFHRPCAIAEIEEAPNGKRRRVYRRWATPFEIFSQTPECERYLRTGVNLSELGRFAQIQSDTEAAIEMQQAKQKLLAAIARRSA